MKIYAIEDVPKTHIIEFFPLYWGSPQRVTSSGVYDCSTLDGLAMLNEDAQIIGLITYILENNECEIISLDSIEEGKGIGTSLVQAVETLAREKKCTCIKLITTNDNLVALKFYQKRDYVLSRILINAVEQARKIKPEIPAIGNDGIPIRDEIELLKVL